MKLIPFIDIKIDCYLIMEPRETLRTARILLFLFLMSICDVSGNDWSYKGTAGPHFWHQLFKTCSGSKQSPINIITQDTVYDPTLTEFAIWFNPPHPHDHMTVINNGYTVKIKTIGKFYITNGGLPNVYKTAQLHFHWGLDNDQGSEHQINSAVYPMELHIVNYDHSKYSSLQEAMTNPLGLAVLGVMFKVTDEDNPVLKPVIDVFGEIQKLGHPKVKINAQSIRNFLPKDTSKFYRYNGSLTTPGCYETVIWTIFKQANYISHGQMQKMRELFYNKEVGGHPHHQHHHHDHEQLMKEEKQATIFKVAFEKQEIPPALASANNQKVGDGHKEEEEKKNQTEVLKSGIDANVQNKTEFTQIDHQPNLEDNHKTQNSGIPSETIKEELKQEEVFIGKDETIIISAKEDTVVLKKHNQVAADKSRQLDQLPKETSEATNTKPDGIPTVEDQQPHLIRDKEGAIPEMQRDASYVQFKILEHDHIKQNRQHYKHNKKHHKHQHHKHHHVSKRDVEGQVTLADNEPSETKKEMSGSSKEENNYLIEGDKKLDQIEEAIHQSDKIYEEIKKKIEAHKVDQVKIINNYRPVQPLNDRVVLRSFQSFEEDRVWVRGYEVPSEKPESVHSRAEVERSSLTRICIMLFTIFTLNLLTLV